MVEWVSLCTMDETAMEHRLEAANARCSQVHDEQAELVQDRWRVASGILAVKQKQGCRQHITSMHVDDRPGERWTYLQEL